MASTNQSPFYQKAEQNFLSATEPEEKLMFLDEMIKECPKHKSSEKMLSNLKNRYRKLKESIEKQKKSGKSSSKNSIKKSEMQVCVVGFPNTGKSSVFEILTNKKYEKSTIASHAFSTYSPVLGMMNVDDMQVQIIDMPPFPNHDKSTINVTDILLLVIDNLKQVVDAEEIIKRTNAKIILIYNKTDLLSENEKRKLSETLKSKYKNFEYVLFSNKPQKQEIEKIKNKILDFFIPNKFIRIYTKEPKKSASKEPMILKSNSSVSDAAEKILKGMSKKIKTTKISGPSSKFSGQVVGLEHVLKDKDVVEFQTL